MRPLFGSILFCGAIVCSAALSATESTGGTGPAAINSTFPVLTAPVADDGFGSAVTLDAAGTELLVTGSTATYLFTVVGGQWTLTSTFACNLGAGRAALSADGSTVLLGGRNGACLYQADGRVWAASPSVLATFPGYYGGQLEVALSGDGATALVGLGDYAVVYEGGALLYQAVGGVWPAYPMPIATFTPPPASYEFGRTVALSMDGNTAVIGDPHAIGRPGCVSGGTGATYLYRSIGGTWAGSPAITTTMTGNQDSSDLCEYFGATLALSADGNTVLAGASGAATPKPGTLFQATSSVWPASPAQVATFPVGGHAAALSANGAIALLDTELFQAANGAWLTAPAPVVSFSGNTCSLGPAAALSADGLTAAFGAPACDPGGGLVYVFKGSDLALAASVDSDSILAMQPFTIRFRVTNASASVSAHAVRLSDALPAGTSFISGSAGCAASGTVVTCDFANLDPQMSWQPAITVVADTASGDVTDVASVTANDYNLNAHSAVSISVAVSGPPPGGGGGSFAWLCIVALGIPALGRRDAQDQR